MTGPVERVPLTDEQLERLETLWLGPDGTGRTAEALTTAELASFGRIALEDAPGLLAELREADDREMVERINQAIQATDLARQRDPVYVLQDIAAKRRIIHEFQQADFATHPDYEGGYASGLELAVRLLAAPFSSHPDWQPEWSVE